MVVCADLDLVHATETADLCVDNHHSDKAFQASAHDVDVRDEASVDTLMTQVVAQHGRIDVLINTAGVGFSDHLGSVTTPDE